MPQYAILIYEDEQGWIDWGPEAQQGMQDHRAFGERRGEKLTGGAALQPTSTATTLRRDGEDFAVTDGPFVETKEVLGGFYMVQAADLDEAIALAKEVPSPFGGVEVRPVMDTSQMGQ